jgi:hypothetical protein
MTVFYKIQNVLSALLFICLFSAQNSCAPPETTQEDVLALDNEYLIEESKAVNKSESEEQKIAYIKDKSLMFFRLNPREYQTLLSQTGDVASYEFKYLFERFDRAASEFGIAVRKYGIDSDMLYEQKIIYITDTGRYSFDRENEDMIMGQIFFDGKDSIIIEDGYIEPADLQLMIKDFFRTDSIRINASNLVLSIDTITFSDTVEQEQVPDTLAQKTDSLTSGTQIE